MEAEQACKVWDDRGAAAEHGACWDSCTESLGEVVMIVCKTGANVWSGSWNWGL